MAARIAGALRIALLDRHAHRLELGRSLGATEDVGAMDALAGPFEHIVDTTGAPAPVAPAVHLLAARGTLEVAAAYTDGPNFPLEPPRVMNLGRRTIRVS